MNVRVDITGILERAGADAAAPEGSQAWALAQVDAAIAQLIEAAVEMSAELDTYAFDYGVTQHGLSVKNRMRTALASVGGAK